MYILHFNLLLLHMPWNGYDNHKPPKEYKLLLGKYTKIIIKNKYYNSILQN